jgi:hypothetical protein
MLKGSLTSVSLSGLVQVLSAERRTGRLDWRSGTPADGRRGSFWLDSGKVVHAEAEGVGHGEHRGTATLVGEDALYELLLVEEGEFSFEAGPLPPRRSVTSSTEHLLIEAACRRDQARGRLPDEVEVDGESVASFAPVPDGVTTPRFDTLQWRLLASIDGKKPVATLARDVGLPLDTARAMVAGLVGAGVLRLQ